MYRIGIDLGGTNIAVGVVDDHHRIVAEASLPAGAHRPAEQVPGVPTPMEAQSAGVRPALSSASSTARHISARSHKVSARYRSPVGKKH